MNVAYRTRQRAAPIARSYARWGKRLMDVAVAAVLLVSMAPLIGLLALMVSLDGHSPFFAHRRVGKGGRRFGCLKLRTMVPDAEARLKEILARDPSARAEWRRGRKLTEDPRVTRLGRFLRQTSLDELPQLLNVILGDMSLVGPRPVTEDELSLYGTDVHAYLATRPALTGPWQVQGRNDLSYADRVRLDVEYVRRVSLVLDLAILLATARAVIRRTGR